MTTTTNPRFSSLIRNFHQDEDGIEAVQVVMIVAIAAIILVAMMTVGNKIYGWMEKKWGELEGTKIG